MFSCFVKVFSFFIFLLVKKFDAKIKDVLAAKKICRRKKIIENTYFI